MHEKRIAKAYHIELWTSVAVYMVLLFVSIRFGRPMAEGLLRTVVLASPMLGFGLMLWACTRHVARIDEYARQRILETFALAAAITAGVTFTYGFLETAGYPRLSMFTVWGVMGGAWCIVSLVRGWRDR